MEQGSLWVAFVDGDKVAREAEDLGQRWRERKARLTRGGQVVGLGKNMCVWESCGLN